MVTPNQPVWAVAVPCGADAASDNDRKYYSIDRAREVLDYDPRDNSAEYAD